MARSNQAVSIAFHADKIVVMRLMKSFGKMKIKGSFTIPVTPKAGFYAEPPDQIAATISMHLKQNNWKPEKVILGVPRNTVIVQTVDIPVVAERDIKQIMQYELERHIPTNAQDYVYDVLLQDEALVNQLRIFLAAISQTILNQYLQIAELLGIPVECVQINPLALVNAFHAAQRSIDSKRHLLIHIDDLEVDYVLFEGKNIRYIRSLSRPPRFASSPESASDESLLNQVNEQIRFLNNTLRIPADEPLMQNIVLTGADSVEKSLQEELTRMTGAPVIFLNPVYELDPQHSDFRSAATMTTAFGLAAQSVDERLLNLNLMPVAKRYIPSQKSIVISAVLLGIISALVLAIFGSVFIKQQVSLQTIQAQVAALAPEVQAIKKGNEDYQHMQTQLEMFRKFHVETPKKLEVLFELTRILPDGSQDNNKLVWLTSLNIKDTEVVLRGKSESPEELIALLEESDYFENVKFDSAGITKTDFVIKMSLSKRKPQVVTVTDTAEEGKKPGETGETGDTGQKANGTATPTKPVQATQAPVPTTTPTARGLPPSWHEVNQTHQQETEPQPAVEPPHEFSDAQPPEPPPMEESEAAMQPPASDHEIDLNEARKNLFEYLRTQRENPDAPRSTPPPGAQSFIEFLQQASKGQGESGEQNE